MSEVEPRQVLTVFEVLAMADGDPELDKLALLKPPSGPSGGGSRVRELELANARLRSLVQLLLATHPGVRKAARGARRKLRRASLAPKAPVTFDELFRVELWRRLRHDR